MRILVIGAGVLGCNMAANLYRAGKDVTLLARGDWYNTIKENGLSIRNRLGFGTKNYPIKVISELRGDDIYDIIFVSLRFTQLGSIYALLNSNSSKNIIFNGNNTRVQDVLEHLPHRNVMFSFSQSAGTKENDRINSIDLKKITIGDIKGRDNEALIRQMFEGTGYKLVYQRNMKDYLLSHAAYIVPLAFASYYCDGELRKIKNDKVYMDKVVKACIECYRALDKTGVEILPAADREYDSPKWYKSMMSFFKLMASTALGRICISDHAMSAKDEMSALAGDLREIIDNSGDDAICFKEITEKFLV